MQRHARDATGARLPRLPAPTDDDAAGGSARGSRRRARPPCRRAQRRRTARRGGTSGWRTGAAWNENSQTANTVTAASPAIRCAGRQRRQRDGEADGGHQQPGLDPGEPHVVAVERHQPGNQRRDHHDCRDDRRASRAADPADQPERLAGEGEAADQQGGARDGEPPRRPGPLGVVGAGEEGAASRASGPATHSTAPKNEASGKRPGPAGALPRDEQQQRHDQRKPDPQHPGLWW